jgi:hypothetical protein
VDTTCKLGVTLIKLLLSFQKLLLIFQTPLKLALRCNCPAVSIMAPSYVHVHADFVESTMHFEQGILDPCSFTWVSI